MNDGMIQTHELTGGQVRAMLRNSQRYIVALEKILSIAGEQTPIGAIVLDALKPLR